MNDPNQDKAATRIQASFRGYKTRKELGAGGSSDQQPSTSSHTHDEYDNGHNTSRMQIFDIYIYIYNLFSLSFILIS